MAISPRHHGPRRPRAASRPRGKRKVLLPFSARTRGRAALRNSEPPPSRGQALVRLDLVRRQDLAHRSLGEFRQAGMASLRPGTRTNYVIGHAAPPRFSKDAKIARIEIDPEELGTSARIGRRRCWPPVSANDAGEGETDANLTSSGHAHTQERHRRGPSLAEQVADQLMAHDAIGAHARDELGFAPHQ